MHHLKKSKARVRNHQLGIADSMAFSTEVAPHSEVEERVPGLFRTLYLQEIASPGREAREVGLPARWTSLDRDLVAARSYGFGGDPSQNSHDVGLALGRLPDCELPPHSCPLFD